jgi:hypothetical protein
MKAVENDPSRDRIMTILVDQAVDHVEEEKTKRERAGRLTAEQEAEQQKQQRLTAEQHLGRTKELLQLHEQASQRSLEALMSGNTEEALRHAQQAKEIAAERNRVQAHFDAGEHGQAEEVHRAAMKRFGEAG